MPNLDDQTAERIAPLLKQAVAAQIQVDHLVGEMEEIIAGDNCQERDRQLVEDLVTQSVLDLAGGSETAEGLAIEDAKVVLEEIGDILR